MCSEKLLFWVGFAAGTFLTSVGDSAPTFDETGAPAFWK